MNLEFKCISCGADLPKTTAIEIRDGPAGDEYEIKMDCLDFSKGIYRVTLGNEKELLKVIEKDIARSKEIVLQREAEKLSELVLSEAYLKRIYLGERKEIDVEERNLISYSHNCICSLSEQMERAKGGLDAKCAEAILSAPEVKLYEEVTSEEISIKKLEVPFNALQKYFRHFSEVVEISRIKSDLIVKMFLSQAGENWKPKPLYR